MEKPTKFVLPSPNFGSNFKESLKSKPHFLTPCGMTLLPREKQPPPMYGPRGTTLPAKYLQNQQQQNHKINKAREAQQQERQFCEPCEMELQSTEDLRRHRAQHEPCPVDGCSYRGHASIMDKHVATLHASGLFDTFKKLSTPEEIAAWREERRKKYPTVANVQMRQRAQEQRQKRGERLETNQNRFGRREDRKRIQKGNGDHEKHGKEREGDIQKGKRNDKRMNKRRKVQAEKREFKQNKIETPNNFKEENIKALVTENYEDIQCGGIFMFRGTSLLKDYKHAKVKMEVKTNALAGLLGMYGSDDDDDEEDNDTVEMLLSKETSEIRDNNSMGNMFTNEQDESLNLCTESQANDQKESVHILHSPSNDIKNDKQQHKIQTKEIIKCENNTIEEIVKVNDVVDISENQITCNAASSDEAPEEVPIMHASNFQMSIKPSKTNETNIGESNNETSKGESKHDSSSKRPSTQNLPRNIKKNSKRKSGLDYRKARLRKQNTMLEKLLEPDIRHERNVLLQCVRYVCENNFFGIGQGKK